MKLRVGSLFTGIGGMDLGLERTGGFRTVWMAESDPYRRRVLARHWPDVRLLRDVRHVHPKTAEAVDLVCGGFPCPDLSDAGKHAGIAGARSGLWKEMARVVADFRPGWVLCENVPALAHKGLATVLRDLAALGYDAEWSCISAAAIGAPHERNRLWIVAYPHADEDRREHDGYAQGDDEGPSRARAGALGERRGPGDGRSGRRAHSDPVEPPRVFTPELWQAVAANAALLWGPRVGWRRDVDLPAHAEPEAGRARSLLGVGGQRAGGGRGATSWATEPRVDRVADGVPRWMDRVAALGDALVPQIVTVLGERILAHYGEHREGQP